MNIVRQSKFRHVFCKPVRPEQCLSGNIYVTEITWESLFAAANSKFLAIITKGAGGPFMVFPIGKTGRVDKDYPVVDAHRAPCLEVAWCPFNENVIASCSEDATCKIWLIPDHGLRRSLNEPIIELNGHQKRVNTCVWHPTTNNVILTAGGDNKILIWNCGTGEALIEIAGHPDQIWSVCFNFNGSKIVTTCRDKQLRVIDPRSGSVLQQGQGHEGVKPQRAIFLKDGRILTTGFSKRSERLYSLRNEESLGEPIVQEELDTSNGVLFPFYDEDSGLVWLAGKGDCAIRYYEVNEDPPFMHYINTHTTSEPQRALAFGSKRGLSLMENEIGRVYKLRTSGVVDILQFFVPRKSDLFQEDLYPDTRAWTPALTAEEWMDGTDKDPILTQLRPEGYEENKPKATVAKKANILTQMPAPQGEAASTVQQRATSPAGSALTAGQKRAAAELERIKRDKDRSAAVEEEVNQAMGPSGGYASRTPRTSISSNAAPGEMSAEEMWSDMQKLKAIIRQHERRIRLMEDQLADKNMSDVWNL